MPPIVVITLRVMLPLEESPLEERHVFRGAGLSPVSGPQAKRPHYNKDTARFASGHHAERDDYNPIHARWLR
jgi:hypothetical protein